MKIKSVEAFAISYVLPPEQRVTLGIGQMVKRDAIVVKVITEGGLVGWGEAHHGRAPGAVAHIINTTLRELVVGMDASDVNGVWHRIYQLQLASHGMGAASAIALSGIDMALWDLRGKATGWPLYKLLGGASKPIRAYAGGIALGFQAPEALADEAETMMAKGYKALKLRIGDTPQADKARVAAVRARLGDDIDILTDANANASFDHIRRIVGALDDAMVGWLEEPFPPHDYRNYKAVKAMARTPLAAGENHYTRFEFNRLVEDGSVSILQPDLSKTGGITEGMRIAALGSAWKLSINPHTSSTSLNMAASIHFLAAMEDPGYFEADESMTNPFRNVLCPASYAVDSNGHVVPLEAPGLGVEVDEDFIAKHPLIDGPCYVK